MKLRRVLALALTLLMVAAAFAGCSGAKSKCVILEEDFGSESYGIGFRKGDNALTLRIQEILDEMIADGTFAKIAANWFTGDVVLKDQTFPREITAAEGDDSLQYILDKGTLILGLDETFPPMGFRDEKGEIVGFDIDLAKEVCKRLGVELQLQPIDWDAKEMELSGKKIDCIWNGMSINEQRAENMNLSKPYLANRQVILTGKDSGITCKADLAGKTVATQAGSAGLEALQADAAVMASIADGKAVEYKSFDEAYIDLQAGRVDAVVIDEVYARYILSK